MAFIVEKDMLLSKNAGLFGIKDLMLDPHLITHLVKEFLGEILYSLCSI